MDWKHGYFAENGYTFGFYEETIPARLAWAATLQGYKANLDQFRYIDLGCGQGLNLVLLAALYPTAEFVGVDFMPEHIAHGRQLAEQAGLKNITFIEGDFTELVKDSKSLGEFDYAVAHGITTWVSPVVREAMFVLAQAVLKPGGMMYNSYNTYPGWLHTAPFQHMVLQYQKQLGGHKALEASKDLFTNLFQTESGSKTNLSSLSARLEGMSKQDSAYLVQEYNNQWWQPVYANQMLELAQSHKLNLIGSATLSEVFEGLYPASLRTLIQQESDPLTREVVRDLAIFQSFRRDLYGKGATKLWPVQKLHAIREQRFIAKEGHPLPPKDQQFSWLAGTVKIMGNWEAFKKVIDAFGTQGASLGEAMSALKQTNLSTMVQQVSLLLQGGWLALEGRTGHPDAHKLNRTMARAVMLGAPYQYLCTPKIQSTMGIGDIDFLMIAQASKGDTAATLGQKLVQSMMALNKRFAQDGQAIQDPALMLTKATEQADGFLKERLKRYEKLGAL